MPFLPGTKVNYTLRHPMIIGSRLLPAVRVSDAGWISVEARGVEDNGRVHFRFYIDAPGVSYESGDSGVTLIAREEDDWGILAARAMSVITSTYAIEDTSDDVCDGNALLALWAQRNSMELHALTEDLQALTETED